MFPRTPENVEAGLGRPADPGCFPTTVPWVRTLSLPTCMPSSVLCLTLQPAHVGKHSKPGPSQATREAEDTPARASQGSWAGLKRHRRLRATDSDQPDTGLSSGTGRQSSPQPANPTESWEEELLAALPTTPPQPPKPENKRKHPGVSIRARARVRASGPAESAAATAGTPSQVAGFPGLQASSPLRGRWQLEWTAHQPPVTAGPRLNESRVLSVLCHQERVQAWSSEGPTRCLPVLCAGKSDSPGPSRGLGAWLGRN